MRIVKRLHIFILKSFLPLFAMTFCIVLFIVLMQFLWRYIDDLVGKGLDIRVIGELFYYAAICMVPQALPLAILLASLMTFGNLGEKFELTAMKAAGVSLLRTMLPLIIFISGVSVGAFFFQNDILPKAQVKMWTLLFSMKQKSPELEIPEKAFYDQITGYSIYVDSKDMNTGMLHDVMIYDVSKGYDNSTVLRSDSARLAFTPDGQHLYLKLWKGEQFDNLMGNSTMSSSSQNMPFRRETFADKEILIKFDKNFNRLDEGNMRKQYVGKDYAELRQTIDSVQGRIDSIGTRYSAMLQTRPFVGISAPFDTVTGKARPMPQAKGDIDFQKLLAGMSASDRSTMYQRAVAAAEQAKMDFEFKAEAMKDDYYAMRRHEIELMKKFTLSVACLLFFFIGAPLGAIIRKGGLGTPLVISVLIFIFYYIIDNTGYKLARDGKWIVWEGMWISSFILAPLGIYVTWKAMNDSAVFNPDAWRNFFTRLLGLHQTRKVEFKEVIIHDITVQEASAQLGELSLMAEEFKQSRLRRPQLFLSFWWKGVDNRFVAPISAKIDAVCDYMSDCRDKVVVGKLLDFPVIMPQWIYHPSHKKWLSALAMLLFPVSIPIWILGYIKQRRLCEDISATIATCKAVDDLLRERLGDAPIS